MSSAIRARKICKSFKSLFGGSKDVLHEIDLDIEKGEVFGILGPNGAGKTTLISVFSTLIRPDEGSLEILGMDALREAHAIRDAINLSSGNPNFPWCLTVRENLRHSAMLYGLYGRDLDDALYESLETFDLLDHADSKFETLSTGLKQRMSLAKSILNRPRLLFLDEPTSGLDPEMALKIRSLVRQIHRDREMTVVLTTHYMPEAEELCDRIAFLRDGRLVALGSPSELKERLGLGESMVVQYDGFIDLERLRQIPGVMEVKASGGQVQILFNKSDGTVSRIIKAFEKAEVQDIRTEMPDLEDVFLELAR